MSECPFCDYAGPSPVLADYDDVYVIEPLGQVTEGHVLVIPKKHVTPEQPDHAALGKAFKVAALEAEWRLCGDYNLILSSGAAATQTVPHYHVHVVPRRAGDGLALPWTDHESKRAVLEQITTQPEHRAARRETYEGLHRIPTSGSTAVDSIGMLPGYTARLV